MNVSVLIPYRTDGSDHRAAALRFVEQWWGNQYPSWQVLRGADRDGDGPWCKAAAVADAFARADGDVLVIADADVVPPGIGPVVSMVESGGTTLWGMPHMRVHRLTEHGTRLVLDGRAFPDPDLSPPARRVPDVQHLREVGRSYKGVVAGGCVVLRRDLYERAPLDPRFLGWGQEDLSWGLALTVFAGPPWRQPAPLWHLWHPPAPRINDRKGSAEGWALWQRYRRATTIVDMTAILAEFARPA